MIREQPFEARFSHIAAPIPREAPLKDCQYVDLMDSERGLEFRGIGTNSDDGELTLEDWRDASFGGRHFA